MHQRIVYLLRQRWAQQLTAAEADELLVILQDDRYNELVTDILQQMAESENQRVALDPVQLQQWVQSIVTIDRETGQMPDQKNPGTPPVHRIYPLRTAWLRYTAAAVLILLLGAGYLLYTGRRHQAAVPLPIAGLQEIAPGGNKAILTLADGSHITLDSAANGVLSQQGNTQVVKSGSGQLSYHAEGMGSAVSFNMVTTPRGGQYRVVLPDGSLVWINAASSLRFPTTFYGKTREVEITGEAYFEVAKDISKPFFVKVNGMSVEVLGTHFNVNAYTDEPDMRTTLLEGSVRVKKDRSSVILQPGQQAAVMNVTAGSTINVVKDADLLGAIAWKNGLFHMSSADIATVMRQIARWYDMEIIFEKGVPSGHITGEVPRNTNLSKVLQVLETSGIQCRVEGKKIYVTS